MSTRSLAGAWFVVLSIECAGGCIASLDEGARGDGGVLRPFGERATTPSTDAAMPYAPLWAEPAAMQALAAAVPGFGASARDRQITLPTRSTIVWVDPDGADGVGTFASPRNVVAPASNTEFRIKAGTTYRPAGVLTFDQQTSWTLTSYDPATGEALTDQPNPRARALQAQWFTEAERSARYARIDMDWSTDKNPAINGTGAILFYAPNGSAVVRGLEFVSWGLAAITVGGNANIRVEDCIFGMTRIDSRIAQNHFAGNVFRIQDATAGGNLDVARVFVHTNVEDIFWVYNKLAANIVHVVDSAIVSTMDAVWYGSNHSDILQTHWYDGVVMQGLVVQQIQAHTVNDLEDWQAV